jgi:hypothetical protein
MPRPRRFGEGAADWHARKTGLQKRRGALSKNLSKNPTFGKFFSGIADAESEVPAERR